MSIEDDAGNGVIIARDALVHLADNDAEQVALRLRQGSHEELYWASTGLLEIIDLLVDFTGVDRRSLLLEAAQSLQESTALAAVSVIVARNQ